MKLYVNDSQTERLVEVNNRFVLDDSRFFSPAQRDSGELVLTAATGADHAILTLNREEVELLREHFRQELLAESFAKSMRGRFD